MNIDVTLVIFDSLVFFRPVAGHEKKNEQRTRIEGFARAFFRTKTWITTGNHKEKHTNTPLRQSDGRFPSF